MKIEYKMEINDLGDLHIFEINSKVKHYSKRLIEGDTFSKIEIELLKIDKDNIGGTGPQYLFSSLKKKIDYILENAEIED